MDKLTRIQHDILQYLADFQRREGRSCTGTEVQQHFGYTHHSTARQHLQALERKGYIELARGGHGVPYHIRLRSPAFSVVDTLRLPVLGAIAAGTPQEAIEETDTWVERLDELLSIRPGDFLLTVKGESMIGEGIFADDLVLIRPQERVAQGEIAAVRVGTDEATLKRVYVEPPNVRLVPANPAMSDMTFSGEEVRILGRFEGLIRLGASHRRR